MTKRAWIAVWLCLTPFGFTTREKMLASWVGLRGAVSIFVDDIDALHADLVRRGARVMSEPSDQNYGIRDFDVTDLDGNMIYFGMPLKRN